MTPFLGSVISLMMYVYECNVYVCRYVCCKVGMNEKPAYGSKKKEELILAGEVRERYIEEIDHRPGLEESE